MGQGSGAEDLGPWTLALEPWIADFEIQLLYLGPRIGVTVGVTQSDLDLMKGVGLQDAEAYGLRGRFA